MMVFILGVNFPDRRLLKSALSSFFGLGPPTVLRILAKFHIHPFTKVGALPSQTVLDLTAHLDTLKIENELRREVLGNIKRLRDTGTYRGRRHAMALPVRGQGTRNQIKTASKLNKVERRL